MSKRRPRTASRAPVPGWPGARAELAIAGILTVAVTAAAYAWAGPAAAVMVLACLALVTLGLLRSLTEGYHVPEQPAEEWQHSSHTMITGFWRKRGMISDATAADGNYDFELRATLQHLLAARLAERHGVSLYEQPDKAREFLLTGTRDKGLWRWLDPTPQPDSAKSGGGIPPRTLAAIIDRLERL